MSIKLALIEANSLGDAWFQAIHKVINEGRKYLITEGSFAGTNRIGMSLVIRINYPNSRPLAPILPEGIPIPTSEEKINKYVAYLITGELQPGEHYTYGEDLSWLCEWAIGHYKKGGFGNNHCYMSVGRPETVYFYEDGVDYEETIVVKERASGRVLQERRITNTWNKNPDIKKSSQCLRGIDTWVEEGRLNFWCYFRSWDLWGGFPENLGGIQLLKEYMAAQIKVEDGIMVVSSKDLHIYEYAWPVALLRLGKDEKFLEGRLGGEK